MSANSQKIQELLTRTITKIYPSKSFLERLLRSGKKLMVYYGIDATGSTLHLDHGTSLFILKRFQKLGHQVVLLIGDFTAQIGDPTGRISPRKQLSREEVLKNCKNYKSQAAKILDFNSKENPPRIIFNSEWWGKMDLERLMKVMMGFTVSKLLARDMFQKRIKDGKEIYLHEFIYPLLQGYDSVALNTDGELGGSDQIFNMLVGRDLMKIHRKKEKFVMAKKLLENPKTGKILMSKSEGRLIGLDEKPLQMYGKIMALPDEVIAACFEHWTEVPMKKVKEIEERLKKKEINPRDAKAKLGQEVVRIYHGEKAARFAEDEFSRIFKEKKMPSEIPEAAIKEKALNILDLLVKTNLVFSKAEAKRLIVQRGVKIDGKLINDWKREIQIEKGQIVQVGKRKFVRIIKTRA